MTAQFTWKKSHASVIEAGGRSSCCLVEVSHEQASKIIKHFRQKLGSHGQPLDS